MFNFANNRDLSQKLSHSFWIVNGEVMHFLQPQGETTVSRMIVERLTEDNALLTDRVDVNTVEITPISIKQRIIFIKDDTGGSSITSFRPRELDTYTGSVSLRSININTITHSGKGVDFKRSNNIIKALEICSKNIIKEPSLRGILRGNHIGGVFKHNVWVFRHRRDYVLIGSGLGTLIQLDYQELQGLNRSGRKKTVENAFGKQFIANSNVLQEFINDKIV